MVWRSEPEIEEERQRYLSQRRAIEPNITEGVYPFRNIKLDRADVEWLLATHESMGYKGPVDWTDAKHRDREGLDLRGADLREANLAGLPLAIMRGALLYRDWLPATVEQRALAVVHLEAADLTGAGLHNVILRGAHLEGARLRDAHLEQGVLREAHLEGASLRAVHLEGASLRWAWLPGADLRLAWFDQETALNHARLTDSDHGTAQLADVRWGNANLAMLPWSSIPMLGDEEVARRVRVGHPRPDTLDGVSDDSPLEQTEEAVRANRQLSLALRAHGINEHADHFAYRAQVLQRRVYRLQGKVLRYFGSLLLDLISGYGYRPLRAFVTYALVILGFMALFLVNSQFIAPHLSWNEALVLSVSSFHGRGFFNSTIALGDTYAQLAAAEAFLGLFIEITFIATFTQRFFAR
jgi:uncharacterized protein YjbI with pentapeptide repeats